MVNGGFAPVAVNVRYGDSIYVRVSTSPRSTPPHFIVGTSVAAMPRIIRSNPPKHKRDVALKARILVVSIVPIDGSALRNGGIVVRRAGSAVAGKLSFADAQHTS